MIGTGIRITLVEEKLFLIVLIYNEQLIKNELVIEPNPANKPEPNPNKPANK